MKVKRKSFMTLLETLIAVSLLSVLLVIVFGFFRELSVMTQMSEQVQKESFQLRYLETRLGFVFERIANENLNVKNKFFFYSQPPNRNFSNSSSLVFTFNNEVRLNPHFSGDVLTRLFLDLNHRLCLVTWPLRSEQPHQYLQEEILLENVVDVNFEFYAAPEKISNKNATDPGSQQTKEQKETQPEKDKWQTEWPKSHKQMPSIIKIVIQMAKNPEALERRNVGTQVDAQEIILNFVLPSSKNPIYYPPD